MAGIQLYLRIMVVLQTFALDQKHLKTRYLNCSLCSEHCCVMAEVDFVAWNWLDPLPPFFLARSTTFASMAARTTRWQLGPSWASSSVIPWRSPAAGRDRKGPRWPLQTSITSWLLFLVGCSDSFYEAFVVQFFTSLTTCWLLCHSCVNRVVCSNEDFAFNFFSFCVIQCFFNVIS